MFDDCESSENKAVQKKADETIAQKQQKQWTNRKEIERITEDLGATALPRENARRSVQQVRSNYPGAQEGGANSLRDPIGPRGDFRHFLSVSPLFYLLQTFSLLATVAASTRT